MDKIFSIYVGTNGVKIAEGMLFEVTHARIAPKSQRELQKIHLLKKILEIEFKAYNIENLHEMIEELISG